MSKVAIIMGSASDWDVMSPACVTLEQFGIPYEKRVLSAHRNPGPLADYVRAARDNGFDIIIAGAGGAAHLPGVIAALTTLPDAFGHSRRDDGHRRGEERRSLRRGHPGPQR